MPAQQSHHQKKFAFEVPCGSVPASSLESGPLKALYTELKAGVAVIPA